MKTAKMLGVTIGIGEKWRELAHKTAERVSKLTGLPVAVIDHVDEGDYCHPSWIKLHIHKMFPDWDSFFYFDADVLALKPWNPQQLFTDLGRPFCVVPEPNSEWVEEECKKWQLPYPDYYFNAGLFIFGQEHGHVLDDAWKCHPDGGKWLEQTVLNRAILTSGVEVCRLPRIFNAMALSGKHVPIFSRCKFHEIVNLHCAGVASAEEVMRLHESYLEKVKTSGRTRNDLLDMLPKWSVGAELGVFAGEFSEEILKRVKPRTLYCIDLFEGMVESGDKDGMNYRTANLENVRKFLDRDDRIFTVKSDSVDFLRSRPSRHLDWVYIDTVHDYDHTAAELKAANTAVAPNGWICGHDYSEAFPGVVRAVNEFAAANGYKIEVFDGDLLPSFAIQKSVCTP